jgi:hypothetical protein
MLSRALTPTHPVAVRAAGLDTAPSDAPALEGRSCSKPDNTLGNINAARNVKLLVVDGLIRCRTQCYSLVALQRIWACSWLLQA